MYPLTDVCLLTFILQFILIYAPLKFYIIFYLSIYLTLPINFMLFIFMLLSVFYFKLKNSLTHFLYGRSSGDKLPQFFFVWERLPLLEDSFAGYSILISMWDLGSSIG